MRYFKLTMQYLFRLDNGKRFFILLLFALPSSLALAYFLPFSNYIGWYVNFSAEFPSYITLLLSPFYKEYIHWGILILSYILMIFSFSAITTIIARSLRIGRFEIKSLFYLINENFFQALYCITLFFISIFLFQSLLSLFLFLWQSILNYALNYIVSVAFTIGSIVLLSWGYSSLAVWLPVMSFNGIKPFRALGIAYAKTRSNSKGFFVSFLFIVAILIVFGILAFLASGIFFSWLITAIGYSVMTVCYITFSILSYFDIEGITREDLIRRPYLRR